MEKLYWKEILSALMLTVTLLGVTACQDSSKPISAVSDVPPGADTEDPNSILARMGTVNLSKKQVISYLQSLDAQIVTAALNKEAGLEDLVKGVALRTNVITRAAGQKWHERTEVKNKVEDAQRNVLYSMYVNEKSAPPADFPDSTMVAEVYQTSQQQQTAAGKPALKPLSEIAPVLKQRLREKQQQLNEQNYLNGLITANPISVDMQKIIQFINMTQAQKQAQGAEPLKEPVARMGNLSISLGLALKSLSSLEQSQQQQLLKNSEKLQQYLQRLALQYFVLNEAIAAEFNARPDVNNHMEQARQQVLYSTYMQAWSAPEADFPGAALVEENYRKNLNKLVVPDRYHLAKIVLSNSGDAASDGSRAQQIADAARSGSSDFASLARQYSNDPQSAKNGGVVGWLNAEALAPDLSKLIKGQQAGTIVGPLQYQWGWQILKIIDYQPARQQTLEEARPALVSALRTKRRSEKEKELIEQLVASEPVTIDKAVLQKLRQQITG